MKVRSRVQRRFRTVLIITAFWALFAASEFIAEYFFLYDLLRIGKVSGSYDFWPDFTGMTILGAVGGLAFGSLLVFKMNKRYHNRSFAFGIFNSALLFVVTFLSLAVAGLFVMAFGYNLFNTSISQAAVESWRNVMLNLYSPSFLVVMFVWAGLVATTQFMLQVSDKFGPGILWKFMTGRYHNPRQEERIFLFLDMKDSTTIAEEIGHEEYFHLLKEVYSDITEPIVESSGEIYQYVGDEVVVTWPVDYGIARNNCLRCFFRVEAALDERKVHYRERYGFSPAFKAGLHIGTATVGEIGVIKKDLVYTGDVLNTTSRIQAECNVRDARILISSVLLARLPMNGSFETIPLGEIHLKGKADPVALSTVLVR